MPGAKPELDDDLPADPFADAGELDTGRDAGPAGDDDEDPIRAAIRKALPQDDDTPTDDAFGAWEEPKARATVSMDQGSDLIEKASRGAARRPAAPPAGDGEAGSTPGEQQTPPPVEKEPEGGTPSSQGAVPTPTPPSGDLDLTGLDDTRAAAVRARVAAADSLADSVAPLFRGREKELEAAGVTPAAAVKRLVDLNSYASEHPADYLAWVATQSARDGRSAEQVIEEAARKLGLKVVAEAADPFEDEDTKKLREENRRLKGYSDVQGPDAPGRRAAADLHAFAAETDPATGALKRPHLKTLEPQISARAKALAAAEKRALTVADLGRIYDQVTQELGMAAAAAPRAPNPPTPAAQPTPAVPSKTNDAALARARAASKSIDGAGQGANRRPALADPNASLADVIRAAMKQQGTA